MPQNLIKVKKYQGVYYLKSKKNRFQGKPDKCFYISYRNLQGKFKREKVGWASEGYNAQMALHVRGERMRKIRHGDEIPDKSDKIEFTFGEAWKKYDKWLKTGKKHPESDRSRYENHIKNRFENKYLSEITPYEIEKFRGELINKDLAPATIKHILILIRQVYNKMKAWKLWEGDHPLKGVKIPKLKNKVERFLTHQEAHTLLTKLNDVSEQLHNMSLISLHTGMRAVELFGLKWGHLDFENNFIHVADTKGDEAEPRKAFMTKTVNEILKSMEKGGSDELVFKARGGGRIKMLSKAYYRAVTDLGFNNGIEDRRQRVTFHTLRHTFASWLAIQGTPIIEIKELLGHETLEMTERYAHLIPDQKRIAVENLEKSFIESRRSESDNSDTTSPTP